ncbi:MAG: tyrosine-type recombinase/integrase [Pyrinomonadaceae bacterium]
MARERKGSIVTRDGKLYARVQFQDEQGKKRDLWRKADNRTHAREIIRQLLTEIEATTTKQLDAANMTFAELAAHYIENYLGDAVYVGEMKVSGVRGRVEALAEVKPLTAHFAKRKIRSITYGDIRAFKQDLLRTPTRHGNQRGLANANKVLGKLRRMFNIAVREQWLSRNPFSNGESLISTETPRTRILSRDEEARLFDAIDAEPLRAHLKGICLIALDCALRSGEIFTLTWQDVDLDRRTITVKAFNSKTARARTVAMTTRLYEWLMTHWLASSQDQSGRVFNVRVTIKTAFRKALKVAGIQDFHFHDCRATAISRMIQVGMPPAEVMRVSGHTTLRAFSVYVRTDIDTAFRAAAALDAFYSQATAPIEASQAIN